MFVQVILAANDMPSINDVTYPELIEIINKVSRRKVVNNL
jgi:damage-control phosphatase, subfamily II, stand-alone protein